MAPRTLGLDPTLHAWMLDNGVRETPALQALRAETAQLEQGRWQMSPEQGQFMAVLAMIAETRRYLELGTFTGYGTLWMAGAIPDEGEIITCERYPEFAGIAKKHWRAAGVADRIALHMTDAIDLLDQLLAERGEGSFDMVFIDADKRPYPEYYARSIRLVRPGGLVLLDNAFRGGGVADPEDTSKATEAIRRVAATLHGDQRVDVSLVPIADGLFIARKRAA